MIKSGGLEVVAQQHTISVPRSDPGLSILDGLSLLGDRLIQTRRDRVDVGGLDPIGTAPGGRVDGVQFSLQVRQIRLDGTLSFDIVEQNTLFYRYCQH